MQNFHRHDKMVTLIRSNQYILPVVNRFGIRLGFRDKTVEGICVEKKVDTDFFLCIINTFHNPGYFPEKELLAFSPLLIIDYLRKTHRYYLEYLLPEMERLLQRLLASCTGQCAGLNMIDSFYHRYKTELQNHINEEETRVFPYVLDLLSDSDHTPRRYSIIDFEKEHSNVEVQINDLKNLIIKYLEPNYDDHICNQFLFTLFSFEKDILDHARIEDKILVPQVKELEKRRPL